MNLKHISGTEGQNNTVLKVKNTLIDDSGKYIGIYVCGTTYSSDINSIKQKDMFVFDDLYYSEYEPQKIENGIFSYIQEINKLVVTAMKDSHSNGSQEVFIHFLERIDSKIIEIKEGMKIKALGPYEFKFI